MNTNKEYIDQDWYYREETIAKYLKGELSESEAHAFEMAALEDPFLEDALGGLEMIGSVQPVAAIQTAVKERARYSKSKWGKVFLTVGVGVVLGTVIFMKDQNEITPEQNTATADLSTAEVLTGTPNEIAENQAHPSSEIVAVSSTDSSVQVKVYRSVPVPQEHYISERLDPPAALEPKDQSEINIGNDNHADLVKPPTSSGSILHVEDYKLMDYRGKREATFEVLTPILTSTHPSQENKTDDPSMPVDAEVRIIGYHEYLEEAITKFAQHDFKGALKQFTTILDKYPDDVNALFYAGMSQFQRQQFAASIPYFEHAAQHDYPLFREEAMFYWACSLIETEQEGEARLLLNQIVVEGKFYASQAKKKLNRLNE